MAVENNLDFPQIFVLKDKGQVIGSFTFKEHDLDEGEYAHFSPWLACVIIRKDLRGKGYGKLLLNYVDYFAQKLFPQLYLFTKHTGYYEKIGFQFIEEISHHDEINRVYKKEY